jgi:hypothetical protein
MIVLVVIPSFLPAQETCAMTEPVQTLLSRLCAAEVFARDVKMQSPDFGTSQESIAGLFLNSTQKKILCHAVASVTPTLIGANRSARAPGPL